MPPPNTTTGAPGEALAKTPHIRPENFGVGMQDAVGGDRTHLRDEDAEDRIDALRHSDQQLMKGVGGVAGFVAIARCNDVAPCQSRPRGFAPTRPTSM